MIWLSFGHVLLKVCMYLEKDQSKLIFYYILNEKEPSKKPSSTWEQQNALSIQKL
jgi:hypothetical protein